MLLKDKSVVIMGAGSGVGRAASLIFARNGAKLICADVVRARVDETVALVTGEGFPAQAVTCDVSNVDQVNAAVQAAVDAYGRLDVIYNNVGISSNKAGGGPPPGFMDIDDAEYDRLADVNFRGMFYGCRAAIRQFLKQDDGEGVIVNTGSVAGMVGWGGTLYGATKAAGIQLTRGLAIEFASKGIRVNTVCPAGMITNFGQAEGATREITPELEARYGQQHPLGRPIAPEDTANAALFLASDQARNITGVALPVDGGYVAA
ncbi:SDR family NAD(P)-dependent oxidoreductase [Novosphingobium pentaromativorans]|uniref:Short-chain dehydrogenase/reductase SDR n=1 Tax=Novosphingobium pentaromativorans US6-1 TaxID=1088721 RepID=G6E845_9SPHN|nr:SDR family oxidoreductase [Novosphingobium pentaromativorans]AIT81448.1 oxidoreductase [Novosphingobium pentaromativorans US6-1]EHJ62385.1 short-chain dehydrogenase/reductase SDR [Novosphingobium pentaromativorans US6-1]